MKVIEEERKPYVGPETVVPRVKYEGPHKRGIEVADFYGFQLLRPLRIDKEDRLVIGIGDYSPDRVTLLRNYLERGFDACTQPVALAHTSKVPYKQELHLKLDIVGSEKSIAETLLIHTALKTLEDLGFKDLYVAINSVGGKESFAPFLRELTAYYRKHINDMDENCQQAFKEDVFEPLRCNSDECQKLRDAAPQPVAFLTEQSRKHFAEVLEFLENLEIPYLLDHHIVGHKDFTARTVFEVRRRTAGDGPDMVLAHGERYDHLARRSGLGRSIPAAGVSIEVTGPRPITRTKERYEEYKTNRGLKPKVFIVQLGAEAKLAVIQLIEMMRRSRIVVQASFAEDGLRGQLSIAEDLQTPIIVIIGHKEVLEGTAIVRTRESRVQAIVNQKDLPSYLKRVC